MKKTAKTKPTPKPAKLTLGQKIKRLFKKGKK